MIHLVKMEEDVGNLENANVRRVHVENNAN